MPTLSLKTYLDIAFGLLVVAFLAWIFHEGEKRVEDADARAVQAQVIHNDEVNKAAQTAIQAAEEHYRTLYASAPVAPVHVSVCQPTRTSAVPGTAVAIGTPRSTGSDDAADIPGAVGQERDIGPLTDHLFDQADAQITALQAIVRAQQQQMQVAHAQ